MRVITKNINEFNRIIIGEKHYFLASIDRNNYLIPGFCKHRGGPLFLGSLSLCRKNVVCPWHSKETSLKHLLEGSLPFVRSGSGIEIIINSFEDLHFSKELISNLSDNIAF